MEIWFYSIVSVLVVSLLSLTSAFFLIIKRDFLLKILHFLVSFAVGNLFGAAFIHLIPAMEEYSNLSLLDGSKFIFSGIILFFILEKFIRWRHCHLPDCDTHKSPFVPVSLAGDTLHNFLDGIIIAVSYMTNIPLGIATTVAVLFHELPQEIGDFGILVKGGFSPKKAILINLLVSLSSILGAAVALIIGMEMNEFVQILLPVTAGGFIYIAGSDLIPELHSEEDWKNSAGQLFFLLAGIGMMYLVKLFIH